MHRWLRTPPSRPARRNARSAWQIFKSAPSTKIKADAIRKEYQALVAAAADAAR